MTVMMRFVFLQLTVIFLHDFLIKDANTQKCKGVWNDTIEYPTDVDVDFIIAYNISGTTKAEQTCFDIIDHFVTIDNDNSIFQYKIGGVSFRRETKATLNPDKTVTFIFKDSPDQTGNSYWEEFPNGVGIIYICYGNVESILIGYSTDQLQLAAEADEVAKKFTDNIANYKISREGC